MDPLVPAGANLYRLGGNLAEAAGLNDPLLRLSMCQSLFHSQSGAVDLRGVVEYAGPLGSMCGQIRFRQ